MRVFQNRILRVMFEPKRDRAAAGYRKLHNEKLTNIIKYYQDNEIQFLLEGVK
jgi:uncharacterized protein (DUF433 family)